MPRPQIASRYVTIEMQVVMNPTLPATTRQIYMCLKALAYGANEATFACDEFTHLFGVAKSTLYRHLSLLVKASVLRFGSPASRITGLVHVEFLAALSQNWESPKSENSLINPLLLADHNIICEQEEEGGVGGIPKLEKVSYLRKASKARQKGGDRPIRSTVLHSRR
jgi:hypothetical protein